MVTRKLIRLRDGARFEQLPIFFGSSLRTCDWGGEPEPDPNDGPPPDGYRDATPDEAAAWPGDPS